jgi:hypothetical protein
MKNKLKIAPLFIILASTCIYSQNYTIKLKKFDNSIYSEKTSCYEVYSSDETIELQQTPFQSILSQKNVSQNSSKGKIIKIKCGKTEYNLKHDLNEYLKDTAFLTLNSPEIINAAKKFNLLDEDLINKIENFVYNHITNKTLGIPLLPASNIMKQKSGDCTEHAVLSAALLRKCKIPTRAVVGAVLTPQFGKENNVFVYHMWAEAYINQKWELVDATCPGIKYPNRYIAFAYHSLKSAMPLNVLSSMGALANTSITYIK